MKRVIVIASILCCLVAVACKKKASVPSGRSIQPVNNLDSNVSLTAKVDGIQWKADTAYAYKVKYAGDSGKIDLYISATQTLNDVSTTMSFTIINYTGPKVYAINPPLVATSYYAAGIRHYGISGQVTIATDSNYALIGIFDFLADTTHITEGAFNVAKP
jgi:hypothetical protein